MPPRTPYPVITATGAVLIDSGASVHLLAPSGVAVTGPSGSQADTTRRRNITLRWRKLVAAGRDDEARADLQAAIRVFKQEIEREAFERAAARYQIPTAPLAEQAVHFGLPSAQPEPEAESLKALRELQSAVSELNSLASDLKSRSGEMTSEEFSHATSSLLDFQQDVVGRLDSVLSQIDKLDDKDDQRDAA